MILTAADLKASREAIEAGVSDVSDGDADTAIAEAQATLESVLGYGIAPDLTDVTVVGSGDGSLWLPQRARTVSGIDLDGSPLEATDYRLGAGGFTVERRSWPDEGVAVISGTFGYAPTDPQYVLARKAVRLLATRDLAQTASRGFPRGMGGALLTGYSTEGAAFQFFTPEGDRGGTGYADVDQLVRRIGMHPLRNPRTLKSLTLRSAGYR